MDTEQGTCPYITIEDEDNLEPIEDRYNSFASERYTEQQKLPHITQRMINSINNYYLKNEHRNYFSLESLDCKWVIVNLKERDTSKSPN